MNDTEPTFSLYFDTNFKCDELPYKRP